ncbi:helix-turn-helix domain-containing protein [Leuconostoc suionicum]|uniref:helix-turn-helix domain-containing protein n=1 Tax=Leuconostoc suionicum TaxID=1511761 RepID=UPI0024AD644E|nr:helix-turn-helix transcriptional regulator [Leuconostoc suionicum]MDI6522035.1 helix-turn-helix transcriptional regulator [Leuconostoc suionicum]MDI6550573.1 helix-turn-helix transcriptional regulator [Leuconostoc suionicum]
MTNNIREERQKKGITLETMSEELSSQGLKISADGLAKYERGIREPKLETWKKLADYFGVSVSYLQGISDIDDSNVDYDNIIHFLGIPKTSYINKLKPQIQKIAELKDNTLESETISKAIESIFYVFDTQDGTMIDQLHSIINSLDLVTQSGENPNFASEEDKYISVEEFIDQNADTLKKLMNLIVKYRTEKL